MTLWGGRFSEPPVGTLWQFTADPSDRRLLVDDITGSLAHLKMLAATGILRPEETDTLIGGLEQILDEAQAGDLRLQPSDEDVHTAVERRLVQLAGEVGKKLHTGRSRNDQVVLDLRLYLRRAVRERIGQIHRLVEVLVRRADEVADVVVPSYTHLQQAQPVSLGHHLLAYAWMLLRDGDRFGDASGRIAVSPLGAGAGGGTSLPLAPELVARELELPNVFENSLDAVSSRDFVAEYAFCCAQLMAHLSRLAEDLVLWATEEFGWVTLPDVLATGSSALPHKKNPDIPELVRGRSARVLGDVTALLAMQKGLPLAYNRDLQEDKPAVFDADDTAAAALEAMTDFLASVEFHPPPPLPNTLALDLAEVMVRRGVPFRVAHEAVGELVARLEVDGRDLRGAITDDLARTLVEDEDLDLLDPAESVARRSSPGGGSFESVARQVAALRQALAERPSQVAPGDQ